ncbi:MAG: ComEC/Rec2 family competence protein [Verrucomicrobiota bacterium]
MRAQEKTSLRAPLAYLLIGLVAGLLLAKVSPLSPGIALAIGLVLTITALALAQSANKEKLWSPCFLLAASFCFWSYGQLRLPAQPAPENLALPLREARLTLKIDRILNPMDRYERVSGFGTVMHAPITSRLQKGQAIYFQVSPPQGVSLPKGAHFEATGLLNPLSPEASGFKNFQAYLKDIGIHYEFRRAYQVELIKPASAFDQFCSQMNARLQGFLRLGSPDDFNLANVYTAMLLGRKIDLTKEQSQRFRLSGTMHLFAISGLHVGVIATVIAQALLLLRIPRRLSPWIGLPLLYLYVEITGASPSAMRAFLMATFFWATFAANRQRAALPALVGSAVFVLLIQPSQLWSIGFQLSYIVVLSILLFGIPLHGNLRSHLQPYRWLPPDAWTWREHSIDWMIDKGTLLLSISFAAWIASTPLSAAHFDFVAPGAVLLNMALVNLAALIITAGVITLSCALIGATILSAFINHAAWLLISLMSTLIQMSLQIPGSYLLLANYPSWICYVSLLAYFTVLWRYHQPHRKAQQQTFLFLTAPLFILLPLAIRIGI